MSTRGAYGFRVNGVDKITYSHSDSYPEGLGQVVVDFLRETPHEELARVAREIILVDGNSRPTPEQIAECRKFADLSVGERRLDDWHCLLRWAQGRPRAYTVGGLRYMIDSRNFLADSLFCEWAYIINLDENIFEVYRGFQKRRDRNRRNRYRNLPRVDEKYYPVALIAEFPLAGIPEDWVAIAYKKAGAEDEYYPPKPIEPLVHNGSVIRRWVELHPRGLRKEEVILPVPEDVRGCTPAETAERAIAQGFEQEPELRGKTAGEVWWIDVVDTTSQRARAGFHVLLEGAVVI